ncbi:MAG: putative mucin/carbohydrate-binding domain-containing protein, partial [Clostridium sp.]
TADEMADGLNNAKFVEGDYIKISHLEQNTRLRINGYVQDAPKDLSTGAKDVDLANSYFYIEGESLRYTNTQLDLSADKSELVAKIEEAKNIAGDNYTKTSFKELQDAIVKGEELVNTPNLFEEDIKEEIKKIQDAINNLKGLNEIVFRGYNNNEFLKVSFDSERKVFKGVSNGEAANPYLGGKYAEVIHHDKKGNVKGRYSINGGHNANEMAEAINTWKYDDGDFLKVYHAEKNNRLVINGYVENAPYDLSTGGVNLDLNNSFFYMNGESLKFSNEQLDLSANKDGLVKKIEEAKKFEGVNYTKASFDNLVKIIAGAEAKVLETNLFESEILEEIEKLNNGISELKGVNRINFMGYNNEIFLDLEFDNENKRFIAKSNGKMVHPYQYSRVYSKVEHFNQKGELKGSYKAIANQTADEMAEGLNSAKFVEGDYIKISHLEQNSRLRINGYVKDAPKDLSTGAKDVDLANSYFYFEGESLRYSNKQLDLSADKSELIAKVNEGKKVKGDNYTKTSFENLQAAIVSGENLINSTNVYESEITEEIAKINKAIEDLRVINVVEFKGYNNEVFMTLGFDNVNKRFVAASNGKLIHPYHYSKEYARVELYNKNGELKGSFKAYANGNADEMAKALNETTFEEGDYIKFNHIEQGNRLAIKGYVNNYNGNLENGVGSLDLSNTKFNLDGENLTVM